MKVTLKNIKINLEFSEETIMFKSDLYIDGKKVGYCENEGRGGNTSYHGFTREDNETIRKCDEYYKSLPKKPHTFHDGRVVEFEQNLESVIDEIIADIANEKEKIRFRKKMEKDMLTKLVLSKGNPDSYETVGWKGGLTIKQILENPLWKSSLVNTINKYKEQGYTILNTNIPKGLV
jgi:hypothetical protein